MANQETEVTLGFNRYGKGDVRLLRVVKNTQRHEIHVSILIFYFLFPKFLHRHLKRRF